MSSRFAFYDDAPNYQSATFPVPRPFQDDAHEALRQGARAGHRCQMLMAATGGGKTFLGLRIIHEALKKGKRAIFVCDRRTLINQTSAVADSYGLSAHGVMMSDHNRFDPSMPFQIASAQTLARRRWPDADVIVIDEAHTQHKVWTEHIQNTRAAVIGLSATPFSDGLGRLFTNLVNATSMHHLTESGVLVPMRVFSCSKVNMRGAATAGGEWTDLAAQERGMEIIGDVVTEWQKFSSDRKTIVFGATIKHCEEMARQFNDSGIMAACFTSDTTEAEREMLLTEYRNPDSSLRVLLSVSALAKGFDVPDVGCVCDVRPLRKSLSEAIQMWGRGLRCSPNTGKQDCILLDFSGNIVRFADDYSDIYYNGLDALDSGEKLDKAIRRDDEEKPEGKACPQCGYKPCGKRCVACGFERQSRSEIEHEAGEMQEIRIGKTKYADDKRHLWEQACTYARGHSAPEKQAGRAKNIYKDIAGDWPPSDWSFATTPSVPITRAVQNKIRSRNIAYAKALAA
jgi:superfamily II DNA or RNA helicase